MLGQVNLDPCGQANGGEHADHSASLPQQSAPIIACCKQNASTAAGRTPIAQLSPQSADLAAITPARLSTNLAAAGMRPEADVALDAV